MLRSGDRLYNRIVRCALAVLIVMAAPLGVPAQRQEPVTESRVRSLAREAESAGRGDKTEMVLLLDQRFRDRFGDFESFPITIVRRDDLSIVLSTPFMTYRRTLAEYLRMGDPVSKIPWIPAAVIDVSPGRLGAPDVTAVVVERNGKAIPPLENRLKPMSFTDGNGDTAIIHAGEVRYPMSAFAPGATVSVAAISKTGDRFAVTLDESQLQTLK
jgi:hypothetical protein